MASHLRALIGKEVRVIFRDPTIIIGSVLVPVLLFPMMGSVIQVGQQATAEEIARLEVGMLSLDASDGNGTLAALLVDVFHAQNVTLRDVPATDDATAVQWALDNGVGTVVVVPVNFTEDIAAGHIATVSVYQVLTHYGEGEAAGTDRVAQAVAAFNAAIVASRASQALPGATVQELLAPAHVERNSVVHGQVHAADPSLVVNAVLAGAVTLPIVISIMMILAAQLAATTVATEKEEKTLEVLLTLPTARENILLGKLGGVFVVALVETAAVFVGFSYYTTSLTSQLESVDLASVGLTPEPVGFVLLGVTLMLSFLAALALAVLLASYAKDIYGAQSMLGLLFIPIFLPGILISFTPVEILPAPVQGVVYAIPFSYPALAGKALYTHDYAPILLGALYQVAFTGLVLFFAARMFTTERLLTARLAFGRRGRRKAQPEEVAPVEPPAQ